MTTEQIIAEAQITMASLKERKPSYLVCATKKVYLHILDWNDTYQDIKVTEDMYYAIRDSHVKEAEHYIKFLSQR